MTVKNIARFTLYLLIVIIILLVLSQTVVYVFVNNKLEQYLQSKIATVSKGEYAFSTDASVNLFTRSIALNNVELIPSRKCINCENVRYTITANKIELNGIHVFTYIKENTLVAENLDFDKLSINIFQGVHKYSKRHADSLKNDFSLNDYLGPNLKSIQINNIGIENALLKIFKGEDDNRPVFSSSENNISVKHFLLDSTVEKLDRLFIADVFEVKVKTFSYLPGDSLYSLVGKNLSSSYSDSLLTIDSLMFIPNYTKQAFGKTVGHQVSRVKITSSKVKFLNMNVKSFLEHNLFISKNIYLDNLSVNVYRDKNIPFKKIVRPPLQQLIREMPFYIYVDSIFVTNGNVVYENLEANAKRSGKITFNKINAVITGLQNDTALYTKSSTLKWDATCLLMNRSLLKTSFSFPLADIKDRFSCRGRLHSMPLNYMNDFMESGSRISVKSGTIDSVIFNFTANEIESWGKMTFAYHDLEIEKLNQYNDSSNFKNQIISFFIREFIINKENPRDNKPLLITDIHFKRDPHRFFFYYTWKSLLSGVKPALGIPEDKGMKKK